VRVKKKKNQQHGTDEAGVAPFGVARRAKHGKARF